MRAVALALALLGGAPVAHAQLRWFSPEGMSHVTAQGYASVASSVEDHCTFGVANEPRTCPWCRQYDRRRRLELAVDPISSDSVTAQARLPPGPALDFDFAGQMKWTPAKGTVSIQLVNACVIAVHVNPDAIAFGDGVATPEEVAKAVQAKCWPDEPVVLLACNSGRPGRCGRRTPSYGRPRGCRIRPTARSGCSTCRTSRCCSGSTTRRRASCLASSSTRCADALRDGESQATTALSFALWRLN